MAAQRNDMTLEFWHNVFQWGSVVLVAITFIFVAGTLWTGNELLDRQAARVQQAENALAAPRGIPAAPQSAAAPPREVAAAPPRTLDAAARASLLDTLRQARPEGPLAIRFVSASTREPAEFAQALADVIEEAGWTLSGGDSSGPTIGAPPVGLLIYVADGAAPPPRARALEDALNRASLAARIESRTSVGAGDVELMVGLRP
jgi:hypothetical protein